MASITNDDELCSFDVPEASRHSSGHTLYKIILQVTPKELTENSYQLVYWKRYTDIRKLYDTLCRYHQAIFRPGKFPDIPAKPGFIDRYDPAVAEERRIGTKNFLNYAIQHKYLRTHDAYINFFQKGEKIVLADVETATLQPEILTPQPSTPNPPPSSEEQQQQQQQPVKETKDDELLLTTEEEDEIKQVTNNAAHILEDLTDLQFEQQQEIKKEQEEIEVINREIDEAANLLSLPLSSTVNDDHFS